MPRTDHLPNPSGVKPLRAAAATATSKPCPPKSCNPAEPKFSARLLAQLEYLLLLLQTRAAAIANATPPAVPYSGVRQGLVRYPTAVFGRALAAVPLPPPPPPQTPSPPRWPAAARRAPCGPHQGGTRSSCVVGGCWVTRWPCPSWSPGCARAVQSSSRGHRPVLLL